MTDELIVVFGGSGFIGRHVVKALARKGYRVRAPMRRPHLGQELRVFGEVGQIHIPQANLRYPESVDRALDGADAVINLVALLSERGKQTFKALHVEGAEAIAEAAKRRGITRVVHVSAIGAGPKAKSRYGRTKAQGEEAMRRHVPTATILRPSIVFGAEDGFFNRFAAMAKVSPFLPLIGGGKTKLQPVWVGDVAQAIVAAATSPATAGRTYELGGPRVYTFKELMRFTLDTIQRKRMLLSLPFSFAGLLGNLFSIGTSLVPIMDPPLTGDQVKLLKTDNIVGASKEESVGTLQDLGVTAPETVEAIAPSYLWPYRPYGQFETRQPQNA